MRAHSLSHYEALAQARHELEREYDGPIPGGQKTIDHRARWYMLSRAEQWWAYARIHGAEALQAKKMGDTRRMNEARMRCRHALDQYRIERKTPMPNLDDRYPGRAAQ